MSALKRILLVFTTLTIGSAGAVFAQANERSVYASVLDKEGAPVTALSAADFVVRENGAEREVLRAAPATDPMQIAVLVDTSQAVERHVNDLRRALRGFFKQMAGKHELALIEFGERPTVLTNYTTDLSQLETGVGRLFAHRGSGAYVLDAIVDASRSLRHREGARHVIVVITTEGPEFSDRFHRTVLEDLDPRAALHAFVLTRRGAPRLDDAARERELTLAKGTTDTGGRREFLLTSQALPDRMIGLANELEHQYLVVYSRPSSLIPPESITVTVKRPDVTVRAPRALRTGT